MKFWGWSCSWGVPRSVVLIAELVVGAAGCGTNGPAARAPGSTLVSVTTEPPGANCASGGVAVSWGVDDDASGILDPGEIDHTEYRCNPPDPGPDPLPRVLVRTQAEPPGRNCEHGGTVVHSGLDLDGDGILDVDEATETAYVCETPDAPPRVLSRVEPVAPGASCSFGGTAVYSGPDANGDGTLETEEIESSAFVCDAATVAKEVEVVAGYGHSCARKSNGTVWCWGDNFSSQLGFVNLSGVPGPVPIVGVQGATSLGAGDSHTCAVVEGGAVWCWGSNQNQQLGTAGSGGPARQVPGVPAMRQVVAGYGHSCSLTLEGTVWCWGRDETGESGQGAAISTVAPALVPGLANVVALAAGSDHTCALQGDGGVRCWGSQVGGAVDAEVCDLGDSCHRAPTLVDGLPAALAITSGSGAVCALTERHQIWCWGSNAYGGLGDGTHVSRPAAAPVLGLDNVTEVASGGDNACAVRSDDSLWCWGNNAFGQLGLGSVGASQPLPRHAVGNYGLAGLALGTYHACGLRDGAAQCWGFNRTQQVGPVGQTTPVEVLVDTLDVSAGNHGACAVLSGGSVWCWGAFDFGEQLGVWDLTPRLKPGLPPARGVAVGSTHACIAALDGSVWCWGGNAYGELGDPFLSSQITPVRVAAIDDAVAIHAGGYQSCAERANGSLWCWGTDGTLFGRGRPPIQILSSVTSVALGDLHGCAVDADHQAWCWGNNEDLQVRLGAPSVAPVTRVRSDVATVNAGYNTSCAVQLDGSLWCWGNWRVSPQPVSVGEFTAIDGGYWHSCLVRPDATAACFGYNSRGQLGDGTFDYHTAPVPVTALSDVIQLSAGYEQTCARRADASLWCWGSNDAGQIGHGGLTERVTTPTRVEL